MAREVAQVSIRATATSAFLLNSGHSRAWRAKVANRLLRVVSRASKLATNTAMLHESNNKEQGMNWEAIGAIGEILGAAVVVATLFYLAKQTKLSVGLYNTGTFL